MKKYDKFINDNNQLNEGLFGFLKKMWNKAATYINKIKGGKEVDEIYKKYLTIINTEFERQAGVKLELGGEQKAEIKKESVVYDYKNFLLNEADGDTKDATVDAQQKQQVDNAVNPPEDKPTTEATPTDVNKVLTAETLKKKLGTMEKIIQLYRDKALKEMNQVLTKMGGAVKNPGLQIIIDNKKDQFNLDFYNAQVSFLEKSGDKTMITKVAAERDKLSKELEARWNTLDKLGQRTGTEGGGDFKVGVKYRYKSEGGIKTIKITKPGDGKNSIFAQYLNKDDGGLNEQTFQIANIDTTFAPVLGETYTYLSNEGVGPIINVTLMEAPDTGRGTVKVSSDKNKEGFNVEIGALRDKVEAQKAPETAPVVSPETAE